MVTRRTRQDLGFVALKIEGGILPAEFLQKVITLEADGQSASDYHVPKGPTLKDEIGRAWRIASAEWQEFQNNRQRTDIDQKSLCIDNWLTTLLKIVLGHADLTTVHPITMAERTFPITHSSSQNCVPMVLATPEFAVDKGSATFGDDGRKRSPHLLLQEYLNATDDCLWGIVSNGLVIRLLRDNPTLTRPAYIEADLERIFQEQLYSDFAAFWLIFHGSRFQPRDNKVTSCFIERWREEAHEIGERALANLRAGVTQALLSLGNGCLQHPINESLRTSLHNGKISPTDYFRELLRLVYRLLFLFSVEERNLLHTERVPQETRNLYRQGYSISRLRDSALSRRNYDKHADLWEGLRITFKGLSHGAEPLGLPALGGLFAEPQCENIDSCSIENRYLLGAIYGLSFFKNGSLLARVNYRDMDTEELGSVYESLLELHPWIDVEKHPWEFAFISLAPNEKTKTKTKGKSKTKGSDRKQSGSYYTPPSLVAELIKSALVPVIEHTKSQNQSDPKRALLGLKIIDPACGSGHFLLAAARRLATDVAELSVVGEAPEELVRRHALREVVQHCIYGVDRNPLAVELCKTALWIETLETGKPLSFLDSHIRCGDSLVGVMTPNAFSDGIPDGAFKSIRGDDDAIAASLKRRNKQGSTSAVQGNLFEKDNLQSVNEGVAIIESMPEDTLEQIEAKQQAWDQAQHATKLVEEDTKANMYVSAFFSRKTKETFDHVPTTEDIGRATMGLHIRPEIINATNQTAKKLAFFHWYTAFPDVFEKGGFDVVLANPPWEHTELKEKEWFAVRKPKIANAMTGANRKSMIEQLAKEDPALYADFMEEARNSEAISLWVRSSGRYPLCGRGRINTYAIFAELCRSLINKNGRIGLLLPPGIVTDDTYKHFSWDVLEKRALVSFFDFVNRRSLFPDIEVNVKFSLLTLSGSQTTTAQLAAQLWHPTELAHNGRVYSLTPEDITKLNPNTRTCPTFKSAADVKIVTAIYDRYHIMVREGKPSRNDWGIDFKQGLFNMTSDSDLFFKREELESSGYILERNEFRKAKQVLLPVYEWKLCSQYNHRMATFDGIPIEDRFVTRAGTNASTEGQLLDPSYVVIPRYWVDAEHVAKEAGSNRFFLGFRNAISAISDSRSLAATILPYVGVGNGMPLILFQDNDWKPLVLLACLNSFVLDYTLRQKASGGNLNFFIMKQLPIPAPEKFLQPMPSLGSRTPKDWIADRVLELLYTSSDLDEFGNHFGCSTGPFRWDPERRLLIRCELDALLFYIFGLNRAEAAHVLDSFPIVKSTEEELYGQFRSKKLILDCLAIFQSGTTFSSLLDPDPGSVSCSKRN